MSKTKIQDLTERRFDNAIHLLMRFGWVEKSFPEGHEKCLSKNCEECSFRMTKDGADQLRRIILSEFRSALKKHQFELVDTKKEEEAALVWVKSMYGEEVAPMTVFIDLIAKGAGVSQK